VCEASRSFAELITEVVEVIEVTSTALPKSAFILTMPKKVTKSTKKYVASGQLKKEIQARRKHQQIKKRVQGRKGARDGKAKSKVADVDDDGPAPTESKRAGKK
jgi:polyhydroxyalkanoate synthesis regulator phasin